MFKTKPKMPDVGHTHHLCYLVNMRFHEKNLKEYMGLVCEGKYVCKYCGRVAAHKGNLCKPQKL